MMQKKAIGLFIPHAGCPFQCIFCDQHQIAGVAELPTDIQVEQAVATCILSGAKADDFELAYFGGSFTAIPRKEMLRYLRLGQRLCKEYGLHGIRISTRPDKLDGDIVDILCEFGVTTVELGAQSMDNTVLQAAQRGHTAQDTEASVSLLRTAGMAVILQMMTGLPGDNEELAIKTAADFSRLAPQGVRIYPTLVIEGTPLEALWRSGAYRPQTMDEAVSLCVRLMRVFECHGIAVVKVGLHAQDTLQSHVVAGPFHPAFREQCMRRLLVQELIKQIPMGSREVTVAISPKDVSLLMGDGQAGLQQLRTETGILEIHLMKDPQLSRGKCLIK